MGPTLLQTDGQIKIGTFKQKGGGEGGDIKSLLNQAAPSQPDSIQIESAIIC